MGYNDTRRPHQTPERKPTKTIPGYLSKNKAAHMLGITRRTLDRHIQKNKTPTFRFVENPTIYVLEEDIKKLSSPIRKDN